MKSGVDELVVMAKTIWGEARGEQTIGQVGVAQVIVTRAQWRPKCWWGSSITEVCLRPKQFSCWNQDDPNRIKLDRLTIEDVDFLKCLAIAARVLAGEWHDLTRGATHYCVAGLKPAWARGRQPTVQLGRHVFFRLGPE